MPLRGVVASREVNTRKSALSDGDCPSDSISFDGPWNCRLTARVNIQTCCCGRNQHWVPPSYLNSQYRGHQQGSSLSESHASGVGGVRRPDTHSTKA